MRVGPSRFCLKVSASYSLIKETPAQNKYLTNLWLMVQRVLLSLYYLLSNLPKCNYSTIIP